jgi:hypothetical protein
MIREDLNGLGGTMEVGTPFDEGMEDSQEFFIVSGVIEFSGRQLAGLKRHWMTILDQSGANGLVAGVAMDLNRVSRDEMSQDWVVCNGLFQGLESLDLAGTLDEWILVFQKVGQWGGHIGEVVKILVIVINQTQKV